MLRGARETLAKTEIIISEIGIAQRHANELSFGEFIQFVESLGFSLIDFAELAPLGSDKPLAISMLFLSELPKNTEFLRDVIT